MFLNTSFGSNQISDYLNSPDYGILNLKTSDNKSKKQIQRYLSQKGLLLLKFSIKHKKIFVLQQKAIPGQKK